jgi:cytidine deaminase
MVDRRTALAALGATGAGLLGRHFAGAEAGERGTDVGQSLPQGISSKSRARLLQVINAPGFNGQIPPDDVKYLIDAEATNIDALQVHLLPLARTYSRPPLSSFQVGAVALGSSGSLYLGGNIEFPGHALGLAVHAEQAALSNAYMHDDPGIAAIAVTAAPCGHCRQFMNELEPEGEIRVLVGTNPATRLSSLLPAAFGPKDLGLKHGAFPVTPIELTLPKGAPDNITAEALAAARKSYAPYTKAYSGIAIGTNAARIYKGSYIENAAFNPSLSPFQVALVALILAGEGGSTIETVVLVEVEGAVISQKSVTEAALSTVAPAAKLRLVTATKSG